jgi:hypothetical protein
MTTTGTMSSHTLAPDLERDRLQHGLERVILVIAALRERESEHRAELGEAPKQLLQAIIEFEAQGAAMNARLRELTPLRTPTRQSSRSSANGP